MTIKEFRLKQGDLELVLVPDRRVLVPLLRTTALDRIPVGDFPTDLVFDGSFMWVVNNGPKTLTKINVTSNAVVATVPVAAGALRAAFDGAFIWVSGGNSVTKVNAATNAVAATIQVGGEGDIAFDGRCMWVTNWFSDTVQKIDITRNRVQSTILLRRSPGIIVFDSRFMWVTIGGGAQTGEVTVFRIDTSSNAVFGPILFRGGPIRDMAFDGNFLWLARDSAVEKVDTNSLLPVASIALGANAIAFDGAFIWVANQNSTVSKIDITTNAVVATIGNISTGFSIAFDGVSMWVANFSPHVVSKIPAYTNYQK